MLISWLLGFFSGFTDALNRGAIKISRSHQLLLSGYGFLIAAAFESVWLFAAGIPSVTPAFWKILLVGVPPALLAQLLTVSAHRSSPMSLTVPYLALTPIFLLVTGPLLGTGTPNTWGAVGVVVVAVGIYVLNAGKGEGLFAPIRAIATERGSWMMIVVALIYAVNANWTKLGPLASSAPFYLVVFHFTMGASAILFALKHLGIRGMSIQGEQGSLFIYGGLIAAGEISLVLAMNPLATVYAIVAKRIGTIIFSILLGLISVRIPRLRDRFKREGEDSHYRVPAIILIVLGMVIVMMWGGA